MSATPEEILDVAEEYSEGAREVDWRNAVSRAYYAAFHRCLELARVERVNVAPSVSEHAALVEGLQDMANAAPLRKAGVILDHCRRRRRKADYELDTDVDHATAETVVRDVREIFVIADTF